MHWPSINWTIILIAFQYFHSVSFQLLNFFSIFFRLIQLNFNSPKLYRVSFLSSLIMSLINLIFLLRKKKFLWICLPENTQFNLCLPLFQLFGFFYFISLSLIHWIILIMMSYIALLYVCKMLQLKGDCMFERKSGIKDTHLAMET